MSGGPTWWDWLELSVLVLTALAAFFAVLATFRVHRLSAGRVTVKMILAGFAPDRGALKTQRKGLFHRVSDNGPEAELAQIVVENPGRTGVTISSVSLRLLGLAESDYTVTPRMFSIDRMGRDTAISENYVRIEPFARITFLLDLWSVVDDVFQKDNRLQAVTVVAEVEAAGHKKPILSKRKWELYRNTRSALDDRRMRRIDDLILLELLRDLAWDSDRKALHLNNFPYAGLAVQKIVARVGPELTGEQINDVVEDAVRHEWSYTAPEDSARPIAVMAAFRIHEQIQRHGDFIDWSPQEQANRWVNGGSPTHRVKENGP